jgi:spore maturation protein CgeB
MSRKFRIAYFAHAVRADWNNGNAHFLRGLLRALGQLGHDVRVFEPADEWSIRNLREEPRGEQALRQFDETYSDLRVITYRPAGADPLLASPLVQDQPGWRSFLRETDFVILHEWNPAALADQLLELRSELGFRLLFHDTHHRASSSPEQIAQLRIDRFDGVLAFGEALRTIYRKRFNIARVWTLHEAADVTVFHPLDPIPKVDDVVWIGNWGDDERSAEICKFLLRPAAELPEYRFTIYGVRYPQQALAALEFARVHYGGYLPNLDSPAAYAASRITLHIPRQQYRLAMNGIPTIRVFEALACGIPLVSAPWNDTEHLFREDDFTMVHTTQEMVAALRTLLCDPKAARQQAARGLETVQARHTCRHRAEQLTSICEELVQ